MVYSLGRRNFIISTSRLIAILGNVNIDTEWPFGFLVLLAYEVDFEIRILPPRLRLTFSSATAARLELPTVRGSVGIRWAPRGDLDSRHRWRSNYANRYMGELSVIEHGSMQGAEIAADVKLRSRPCFAILRRMGGGPNSSISARPTPPYWRWGESRNSPVCW